MPGADRVPRFSPGRRPPLVEIARRARPRVARRAGASIPREAVLPAAPKSELRHALIRKGNSNCRHRNNSSPSSSRSPGPLSAYFTPMYQEWPRAVADVQGSAQPRLLQAGIAVRIVSVCITSPALLRPGPRRSVPIADAGPTARRERTTRPDGVESIHRGRRSNPRRHAGPRRENREA